MSDYPKGSPPSEDHLLDSYLLTLQRLTPRPMLADRILSRVWRPAPRFLRLWRDRLRHLASPRRRWAVCGAMAAGSLGWTVALVAALRQVPWDPQAWLASAGPVSAWSAVAGTVGAGAAAAARESLLALSALGGAASAITVAVLLAPAVSLLGLHLVIRRESRERARSYATG